MVNLYERLGVNNFCDESELRSAFRKFAKVYHPDIPVTGNGEKYKEIRFAFEILSDPSERKNYDQCLRESLAQEKKTYYYDADTCDEEGIDIGTKIQIILAWSTTNPKFDPSLINSFANQLSAGKKLTIKQINTIDNIIRGFKIPVEEWLDDAKREEALAEYFSAHDDDNPYFKAPSAH